MPDAFFRQLDADRFEATEHTAGPWDPRHQHAGPPSALLARAIEALAPREAVLVARIALDILGPLPLGEVTVDATMLRPGRSVELVEAQLSAGGRAVLRATGWRMLASPSDLPATAAGAEPAGKLPAPDDSPAGIGPGWDSGYLSAIEWRFVAGHFLERGPATAWTRMRIPLVDGEDPTPLQRALVVVDSGSGVSNVLDIGSWLFVNPDLTYHVARPARGEWLCLDSVSGIQGGGIGLTRTTLRDLDGIVGVGAQSLFVAPR